MRVGISQLALGHVPYQEFFQRASSAGYEVVEICLRREGEITLGMDPAQVTRVTQAAQAAGVEIVSMCFSHCTGNLLDSGEARERSLVETIKGLELASSMGIGCSLHTLGGLRPDLYYEDAYSNAIDSLKALAPHAERCRVNLAIEFVWNGFLFSPLEMRSLIDAASSDRVGFYFDPGNMAVFQPPQHWVRALGSRVKMVHMKDWRGHALNGEWTPLLSGEVDFKTVMAELRSAGYDGPLISEVDQGMASLEETAQAIRKIMLL